MPKETLQQMTHDITIDAGKGILHTRVEGELTPDSVAKLTLEAGAKASANNLVRLLFDMRKTTTQISTADAHALASHAQHRGIQRNFRRAIVCSGLDEDYQFFETVSENSGYIVRIFRDIDAAITWLMGEDVE